MLEGLCKSETLPMLRFRDMDNVPSCSSTDNATSFWSWQGARLGKEGALVTSFDGLALLESYGTFSSFTDHLLRFSRFPPTWPLVPLPHAPCPVLLVSGVAGGIAPSSAYSLNSYF
jgi:hypothetical protein